MGLAGIEPATSRVHYPSALPTELQALGAPRRSRTSTSLCTKMQTALSTELWAQEGYFRRGKLLSSL